MASISTPHTDQPARVAGTDHHGNVQVDITPGVSALLGDTEALHLGAALLGSSWKSGSEPASDAFPWEEDAVGAAFVMFQYVVRNGLLPTLAAEWAEHRAPTDLPGDEVARIFGENL